MIAFVGELLAWYHSLSTWELTWLCVGFAGQILFGSRFIVQWLVSEYRGESVVPVQFWYLSIGGSLLLFLYATYRIDPVFMVGQSGGLFIYVRNLFLLENGRSTAG